MAPGQCWQRASKAELSKMPPSSGLEVANFKQRAEGEEHIQMSLFQQIFRTFLSANIVLVTEPTGHVAGASYTLLLGLMDKKGV